MLNTTIKQSRTDYLYRMKVYYNSNTGSWVLAFTCMQPGHSGGEEHGYSTFKEALKHFNSNCRFYGVPEQHCTEEEFLGLPAGTLYPVNKEKKNA